MRSAKPLTLSEMNRKGRVHRPTPNQAYASPICALRLGKELRQWVEKAAHVEGHTLASFLRFAARKEADRVLGYNRDYRLTRRAKRPDLEAEAERLNRNQKRYLDEQK